MKHTYFILNLNTPNKHMLEINAALYVGLAKNASSQANYP